MKNIMKMTALRCKAIILDCLRFSSFIYVIFFLLGSQVPSICADDVIRLSLEEAVQTALSNNSTILVSAARLKEQQLMIDSASSEFDLKIRPSAETRYSSDDSIFGAGIRFEKQFETGLSASLSQELEKEDHDYSGKVGLSLHIPLLKTYGKEKTLHAVKQAQFGYRTAERNFYIAQVNVMLDTVFSVYDILKTKNVVSVYESLMERLKDHSVLANTREKVGLATPLDRYRAEIHLKDAETNLNLSREYLQNAEDRLKLILSIPLHRRIEVHAPVNIETVQVDLDEAIQKALKNRVELEQLKDEYQESHRKSSIAKQNIYPNLELVLGYDRYTDSVSFENSFKYNEDRYYFGFSGSTDVMQAKEKSAYQQSLIDIETSELNLSLRRNEIIREVRRQIDSLQKAESRIKIREQQIKQAQGKMAISKIKFTHGMADNFDSIEAETEFQKASVDLLSVKTDYIVGVYRLRAVIGTLIDRRQEAAE